MWMEYFITIGHIVYSWWRFTLVKSVYIIIHTHAKLQTCWTGLFHAHWGQGQVILQRYPYVNLLRLLQWNFLQPATNLKELKALNMSQNLISGPSGTVTLTRNCKFVWCYARCLSTSLLLFLLAMTDFAYQLPLSCICQLEVAIWNSFWKSLTLFRSRLQTFLFDLTFNYHWLTCH